ncbi:hypothetical protein [Streptomyces hypolithicus]
MTDHATTPQAPARPSIAERPVEKVMKAILLVAAVVGTLVALYVGFFVVGFALAD